MLVVGRLKEGKFEKFMGFMQSDKGMAERKKVADVTKTIGAVSPDKKAVMFKIFVHNIDAMHAFVDGFVTGFEPSTNACIASML